MFRAGLLLVALLGLACDASYPTEPSATPASLAELVVHYPVNGARLMAGRFDPRQFEAYAIDEDRLYTKVTAQAAWSSSNEGVLQSSASPGIFLPREPGGADIVATYRGFQAVLPVVVREQPPYPFVEISSTHNAFPIMHFRTDSSLGRQVNEVATWTTSDERIATIERGRVNPRRPGNVRITGTFDGLSDWYWISVPPFGPR